MSSYSSRASAQPSNRRWLVIVLILLVAVGCSVGGWIYWQKRQARLEKMQAQQSKATPSPISASEDATAARAMTNYLNRIRAQVREHEAAYVRLQRSKALAWNFPQQEDIERARQVVREFLNTNERLADSLEHGESFIRVELETAKVPPAVRDSVLESYVKMQKPLLPLQLRIRDCDDTIGQNALAVLNLLDVNWGNWSRDAATGRIDFPSTITLATFKEYVGKIADAANGRKQATEDLANYRRDHPTP
jgi:hypothetical protein